MLYEPISNTATSLFKDFELHLKLDFILWTKSGISTQVFWSKMTSLQPKNFSVEVSPLITI